MKQYEKLAIELLELQTADVITASPGNTPENDVEYDVNDWLGGFKQ